MSDAVPRLNAALEGRYHVERELGAGGMAAVFLAEDLKHHRRVAVKVLHPELGAVLGAERFLREIEVAAGLTHPHILPLHDSGEADGLLFYVMPYIEGESLRVKLDRERQLPVAEAVRIAQQAASALESAHRQGIIHRDIKPGNILLHEGNALVADFGIALAVQAAGGARLTETGLSMGTPSYMSPEQAAGDRELDHRSDIYSLGCVLYEMLVGEPPFTGATMQALIRKIVMEPPPSVRSVRETVSPGLDQTVLQSLSKLPADRYATAGAFADALQPSVSPSAPTPAAALEAASAPKRSAVPWALAAVMTAVAGLALWGPFQDTPPDAPGPIRLTINLPAGDTLVGEGDELALSRDGSALVYKARHNDTTRLYLRRLNGFESTVIEGTEGVVGRPFFSPDGSSVGFFQGGAMKRVSLSGGSPITVTDAFGMLAGSWGTDDVVVYSHMLDVPQLSRVALDGGAPEVVLQADLAAGYWGLRFPQILSAVSATLFTEDESDCDARAALYLGETGERKVLLQHAAGASYSPTQHIVYAQEGALLAVPFDLRRLEPIGAAVSIANNVRMHACGFPSYSLSENGTLAYVPGGHVRGLSELVWVDRQGNATLVTDLQRMFTGPRVSPDDSRIVWWEPYAGESHEWVFDLARGTLTQLTTEGLNFWPIWTPDGRRVTFPSSRPEGPNLFWKPWDGSAPAERLTMSEVGQQPMAWLPDQSALIYQTMGSDSTGLDIWILPLEGDRQPRGLFNTVANEATASLSPDGAWLAYVSDESGQRQIYTTTFPGLTSRVTISIDGGVEPVWAPNGRELFYRSGNKMMSVDIVTDPDFRAGSPRVLFEGEYNGGVLAFGRTYDIAPDGQRFVMVRPVVDSLAGSTQINVILNWPEQLNDPGR